MMQSLLLLFPLYENEFHLSLFRHADGVRRVGRGGILLPRDRHGTRQGYERMGAEVPPVPVR